jgi:hypothetical protein
MNTTVRDEVMLQSIPDFVSIAPMLKATPATEGDRRFIYVEASNESVDLHGEIVLAKALSESADYFATHGNLDLEHYTVIGAKAGIPNHETYEIGLPVDVRVDGAATFVKGEIYSGTGKMAEKANMFWSSVTDIQPAKKWWCSVGGAVLSKSITVDAKTGARTPVIGSVRWSNLAFSRVPVNANLQPASLVPFGPLAKSWGACGIDILKAHSATSNSPDGDVPRKPLSYAAFRDCVAECIGNGLLKASDKTDLVREAASRFGLSDADASKYVERFLDDLKRGILEAV